ncbi:MAG: DUF1569 domain-containing protein [Planctomycetota bacterium]
MKPQRRQLTFATYGDAIAEAERLLAGGYRQAGNWTLGQNCRHLADFMRYSLDGFPTKLRLPWPITAMLRWMFFREKQMAKPMPAGMPTAPFLKQTEPADDAELVAEFVKQCRRVDAQQGEFQKSPIVGRAEPSLWKRVHLKHAELHLGMLVPETAE